MNNVREISLLVVSQEAPYQKALLNRAGRRKDRGAHFSSACFFLPSQLMDELDIVISYSQVLNIITSSAPYNWLLAASSAHGLPPATISGFLCSTTAIWNGITRYTCQTAASSSTRNKGLKTLPTPAICLLTTPSLPLTQTFKSEPCSFNKEPG